MTRNPSVFSGWSVFHFPKFLLKAFSVLKFLSSLHSQIGLCLLEMEWKCSSGTSLRFLSVFIYELPVPALILPLNPSGVPLLLCKANLLICALDPKHSDTLFQ